MRKIDNREFVITWTRSESLEDVMQTMSLTRQQIQSKASYLRKFGVKLKKFDRGGLTKLQVAQLNSLIEKTEKG